MRSRLNALPFFYLFVVANLLHFTNATAAEAPKEVPLVHALSEYGDVTPKHVIETYQKAIGELRAIGGVLQIPAADWKTLQSKSLPLQGLKRTPEFPNETKRWADEPGVTVLSHDGKTVVIQVPPLSGIKIDRPLRLAEGDSLPHWGTNPAVTIDSNIIYGSCSYLDWLQAPVAKGKDAHFYVATVRGLHPGQFINIHGGPGYGGGVTRGAIKSIGYDLEKKLSYIVADTDIDHVAGAILQNKTNTGLLHMLQTSNNDNQTYDVKVIRNQYAHGDTYIYYCDFNYMSNVHSAAGDENGNCYGAFIRSKENNFSGVVESVDWKTAKLVFTNVAKNITTLGDSRPLINLNPKKQLTQGQVIIVAGRSEFEFGDAKMSVYGGVNYGSGLTVNPITKNKEKKFGGLIRGDKNCPWTVDVIGRFFAVSDPSERTPHGGLRWYQITQFKANDDGTKEIEIQRFWWGAKSAGSPTLYRAENYTWDGHEHPLNYIIAPGAYVNDVARALPGGDRGGQRTLGMSPHAAVNTPIDFEKGDAIEQAIGPDPFKPEAFRCWMWEDVPGQYPAAVFDVANYGQTSRYSVLTVAGGPANLDDVAKRHEPKPAWDNVMVVKSAATTGINFAADFGKAAILFQQPNREQPIQWNYDGKLGAPANTASLTVSKSTGELTFSNGAGVKTNGPVTAVTGLSGSAISAKNLRGKNVPVATNVSTATIIFSTPEADADYAVFIEKSWLSNHAISEKTAEGFKITFEKNAPDKATLDWMLVR
ncbi:MAG: hypothetical protein WCT04_12870 [Planctomycetota bacterium]